MDRQFDRLEATMADGRDWFVLGRRTVADPYLYVMCTWKYGTRTPLAAHPHLDRHRARLDADPDVSWTPAAEDRA